MIVAFLRELLELLELDVRAARDQWRRLRDEHRRRDVDNGTDICALVIERCRVWRRNDGRP